MTIGGGRRRSLLALLLVHPNEVVPAERLIDELWEGRPPRTAAKGLQIHVSHLRKELGLRAHDNGNGAALLTRSTGYVLQVNPETIDAVRFEHALADAGRARAEGRTKQAAALLREGLALWRGPPLRRTRFGNVSIAGVAASDRRAWIAAASAGPLRR